MHQNRAILCGCGGDFLPLPKKSRDFLRPQDARFPLRRRTIASEPRFLLRIKWVKMVLAAEFPAIPSSAAKIASERRCAILVHSGLQLIRAISGNTGLVPCATRSVELLFRTLRGFGKGQTGISPEFRATWLSRREKNGPFPAIFRLFTYVWGKKAQEKNPRLNPGMRVSLVIVLPQKAFRERRCVRQRSLGCSLSVPKATRNLRGNKRPVLLESPFVKSFPNARKRGL